MPYFLYKAQTSDNQTESGTIEAENEDQLAQKLKAEGKFLIWFESQNKKKIIDIKAFFGKIPILGRIPFLEKIMFTRNLEVMISAGVSLPKALDVLTAQSDSAKFKKVIQVLKQDVVKGKSLSYALQQHPNVFPDFFSNMIIAGEESGSVTTSLKNLTEQMEKEYDLKSKIKSALVYPIVIISAMIGIGFLMMIMVVPMIADTFNQLDVELPLATRIIMGLGLFIAGYWYIIILAAIVLAFLMIKFLKTKIGKVIKYNILLKLPIVSGLIKKINLAYICRSLSSLISSGVSLTKSLDLIYLSVNNIFYKKAIKETASDIQKGIKLGDALAKHDKIFSSLAIQMIQVGEETGETASLLKKLAEFYEEETASITKNLSTLIEPFLMLIIGGAVGFFAVSIIQPIYSMLGSI